MLLPSVYVSKDGGHHDQLGSPGWIHVTGALFGLPGGSKQECCLGCHTLTSATLQTVANQCISYDKDLWKGSVGSDGEPVRTPLADSVGSNVNPDKTNLYDAHAAKPFNYHLNCWRKTLTENKGKCLLCHVSSCNTDQKTHDFPIIKKLSLKFEKRLEADN